MPWRKASRFPPRVARLLALVTTVPLVALLWVCWRVLAQDRALEEQQIRQRVERATDIATAALQRAVEASERRLVEGNKDWTDGRYVVFFKGVKGKDGQWQLWRVAAEGGEPQRLGLNVTGQLTGALRLHPDGRRVAIADVKVNLEVWVMENFLPPAKAAK
ncbi:MAG: hypothetical protein MUQ25_19765 [Candidatus Aminicenantes bacterium]|nr:hypothetical protein [Candidatus Aminicenantes bacterium]